VSSGLEEVRTFFLCFLDVKNIMAMVRDFCAILALNMAHPFEKMFDKALAKSTEFDNAVLTEAERLQEKGYSSIEIAGILDKLARSLIDEKEAKIVIEALEEFKHYLPDADDEGESD